MPRIFIAGISGLFGLNAALVCRDRAAVCGSYRLHPVAIPGGRTFALDACDGAGVAAAIADAAPSLVVNATGLTNVEACERDPVLAERFNVVAARVVAEAAVRVGARLVHLSTDHLFDGVSPLNREETIPSPLNAYARTKLAAEREVACACPDALIVRTNFFGWGSPLKASFSDWVLSALRQGRPLTMFTDVFFTPILVNDLVEVILDLNARGASGVWNAPGGERLSKYDFALRLAARFGLPPALIKPVSIRDFTSPARRPRDMSLACGKAAACLGRSLPTVAEGLDRLWALERADWPQRLASAVREGSV